MSEFPGVGRAPSAGGGPSASGSVVKGRSVLAALGGGSTESWRSTFNPMTHFSYLENAVRFGEKLNGF